MRPARSPAIQTPRVARRRFLSGLALGAGAAWLAGCQSAASAPPAPAAPPAGPSAGAGAAAPADWERQWDALVEGARREGVVVFAGPPTPEVRTQTAAAFKSRFGVDVEYIGGRRSDLVVRLAAERAAGLYTVDVVVGGGDTIVREFYPQGMLDPVRPALIHPEVLDPAKWKLGRIWFIDPDDQYALRLANQVSVALAVNTTKVAADEIRSAQDLLNLRYRGLIAQDDPTVTGVGLNAAGRLYSTLGEDYLRRLYVDQEVQFTRERRQLSEWLGRGTYPIVVNPNESDVLEPLERDGFPVAVVPRLTDLEGFVSAGSGIMILLNNAPHPNAARLLVNWLASREGMEAYTRAEKTVPLRTDIDPTWAHDYSIPQPGVEYFDIYDWDYTLADKATLGARIRSWRGQ
ncbi:MAG TPA: extracellular solute-binding protein [Chloroflexota bacterium]|jgi:iron(III) transport system substrate-binding protein